MNALVSLILATALILGGGATAVAAQDDLPTQSLYQVKLWTENAELALAGEPQAEANLLMDMVQTRVQEMAVLAEEGIPAPDRVRDRLQEHLRQTLVLAAAMDEADLTQTLLQLRDCLQTQDRIMEQLQLHVDADTEPLLTQTRQMLQTHLQLVDQALADPQGFQYMMNNQFRYGQEEELVPEPNQQGEPGIQQNEQSGQPVDKSGSGNSNGAPGGQSPDNSQGGDGSGNEAPGGPNPESPQSENGGNGSGNEVPGGQNPAAPQSGSGSGSGNGNGSGPGGGGGNK